MQIVKPVGYSCRRCALRILNKIGQQKLAAYHSSWHFIIFIFVLFAAQGFSLVAYGQEQNVDISSLFLMQSNSLFWFAATCASLAFASVLTIIVLRQRSVYKQEKSVLQAAFAEIRRQVDYSECLLHNDDQLTLIFFSLPAEPQSISQAYADNVKIFGRLSLDADNGKKFVSHILDYPSWLEPASVQHLQHSFQTLCQTGTGFEFNAKMSSGDMVKIMGRMIGQIPMLRIKKLQDTYLQVAELEAKAKQLEQTQDIVYRLLDAADMPFWLRDAMGRLSWVNQAYVHAVDAEDTAHTIAEDHELLDSDARADIIKLHQDKTIIKNRMSATLAGQRRAVDIVDINIHHGSAGIATDVTDVVEAQNDLTRLMEFHARTLDELKTPIAVFNQAQRLQFYNSAYQDLWQFDHAFLDAKPLESEILDHLRAQRLLQEQSNFVQWRDTFLQHYQALERCADDWWHLPDGRTLRVIITPHPQGGVTQIFENVTEELDLRSRLKRLSQIQGETLDHLSEGVAVFNSDGRLQLFNPAFLKIWGIAEDTVQSGQHIAQLVERQFTKQQKQAAGQWKKISMIITSLKDHRDTEAGQIVSSDEKTIDYALVPLPDGMSMLTFVDVTDSVQKKQALIERNQALETADTIKSTFIKHVSYALRAPLTNIIGFAQLLAEPMIGQLNDKQNEYVTHILSSSSSLMAIINDVMDLATVEAGIMELDLTEVDINVTVAAVIGACQDNLQDSQIELLSNVPKDIGSFIGDSKRVRQVLFNVLNNAIRFSSVGGQVTLSCQREAEDIVFAVSDNGPGIPGTYQETAFQPFESKAPEDGKRHVGLGLSLVQKFMELHKGTVTISSEEGQSTQVVCRFPAQPQPVPQAAE